MENTETIQLGSKGTYLLNHETGRARILQIPRIKRRKRYRIPEHINYNGKRYIIDEIDICEWRGKCVKHIVIPNTIEYLDPDSFCGCPNLRSIYIGKGVEFIDSWLFAHTKKLRCFAIHPDNPHIFYENGVIYSKDDDTALTSPFQLSKIVIREGTKSIHPLAFWYNERLESVVLPSTLKNIGSNAFAGCCLLRDINIPEGLEHVGENCFGDCLSLELPIIPKSIQNI